MNDDVNKKYWKWREKLVAYLIDRDGLLDAEFNTIVDIVDELTTVLGLSK